MSELSLEEAVAIFHAAILVVRYKEIDENERNAKSYFDHLELSALLNDLSFANDPNFKVNPIFLAHGIKLISGKKGLWKELLFNTNRLQARNYHVQGIGKMNEIDENVGLGFPSIIGSVIAVDQLKLEQDILKQKNQLVVKIFKKEYVSCNVSLSECLLLQFNSDSYLEMLCNQEAVKENTELKAELKSLRHRYEPETLTSSSKSSLLKSPRDLILIKSSAFKYLRCTVLVLFLFD